MIPIRSQRAHRIPGLTMIEKGLDLVQGKHESCRRNIRGVDLNKPVAALAWLFSNSCRLFTRSCWPLHQISDPYSATVVAAATTTLRIRLTSKPPLLLLGLATRCRALSALMFSKCVLKDNFGSSQKPSHLVAPCLIEKVCSPMRMTASFYGAR
jgi:hypothetical protein